MNIKQYNFEYQQKERVKVVVIVIVKGESVTLIQRNLFLLEGQEKDICIKSGMIWREEIMHRSGERSFSAEKGQF